MQSPVNPKARFQDREAFAAHLIEERVKAQAVLELYPRPLYELLADAKSEMFSSVAVIVETDPERVVELYAQRVLDMAESDKVVVQDARNVLARIDAAFLEHFPGKTEIAGYELSVKAKYTYPLGKGADWVRTQREQNPEVVDSYFRFDPAEKAAVRDDMERLGSGELDPASPAGQFLKGLSEYHTAKFNGIEVKIKEA